MMDHVDNNMSSQKKQHLCILEKDGREQDDATYIIKAGDDISFDIRVFESLADGGCSPTHHDLLMVCAAVEFADRHWRRSKKWWSRNLEITVPVIELKKWQDNAVKCSLTDVLTYLTGDSWTFNFVQSQKLKPVDSHQLQFNLQLKKLFTIAYSEGLDSRAVSALTGSPDEGICMRVVKKHHPPQHGDNSFVEIMFNVNNKNGSESTFRSRGFQFAAMTAIAADITKIERIVVPESGQGALGPAMLPLYRLYADYRNYPPFFRKMEVFILALLEHKITYEQPRLWFTKGQTMRAFLNLPGKTISDLICTRSCWQTRHVVNVGGSQRQCGLCASCILRRFSLFAAGITEPPETYVISDLTKPNVFDAMHLVSNPDDKDNMLEYGTVGVRHFQHLADLVHENDFELEIYSREIAKAMNLPEAKSLTNLKNLLVTHAQEWQTFLEAQGKQSFLLRWINGGN